VIGIPGADRHDRRRATSSGVEWHGRCSASRGAGSGVGDRWERFGLAEGVRERMIAGAVRLLAQQGLQATSFAEVLQLTGAPRGSIYHHFPAGKDQLVAAAVEASGRQALSILDGLAGESPERITETFLGLWRLLL